MKYYVYFGCVNSDNYDASDKPVYELKEFDDIEIVREFYKEWLESIYDECDNVIFRVISGTEWTV